MLQQIISSLVTVGGLGFINYYVAEQMDVIDFKGKDERLIVPCMLCFSAIDYVIYLLISFVLSSLVHNQNLNAAISLILTIFVSFLLTLFSINYVSSVANKLINYKRKKQSFSEIQNDDLWNYFLKDDKETRCYVYDFDNNFIANGWIQVSNKNSDHLAMSLDPFETNISNDKLHEFINKHYESYTINQLVFPDKKIKIYLLKDKKGD